MSLSNGKAIGCMAVWLAAAILLPAWLLLPFHVGWPRDCTPSGRAFFEEALYCSPALLDGGWRERAVFALLWAQAAVFLAVLLLGIWRLIKSFLDARL